MPHPLSPPTSVAGALGDQRTGIKVVVHAGPALFQETLTQALVLRGHLVQSSTRADMLPALSQIRRLGPDVCVIGAIERPSWVGALRWLRERTPGVKIVVLDSGPSSEVERAYAAGVVDGVVERGCAFEQLHAAVMRTVRGDRCLAVAQPPTPATADPTPELSCREKQVLAGLVRGDSTYAISQELRISPYTVRTHVSSLMRKLGVHERAKAVHLAVARDLLQPHSA